jgi:hypothetical protein
VAWRVAPVLADSPERNREQILMLRTYAGQEHDGFNSINSNYHECVVPLAV